VDRARARLAELDRRRAEAKDEIRDAESVLRGATLERKRVQARIARLD
jgi:flagellar motility protein MotE (MotC chaperone)